MYERILIPLDGSQVAEKILPYVEALADKFGSSVTLLRALTPLDAFITSTAAVPIMGQAFPLYTAGDPAELAEAERAQATDYLGKIAKRLSKRGIKVKQAQPEGAAAEAIIEWARAPGTDLIAMTTHGRGGLGRVVMGSVADEVIRNTPCPVLLVRASGDSIQETAP
jgi:nucleotide-binding universal stress UspA family protein